MQTATIKPLCGGQHPPGVGCIWCSRADIDARYSVLVDHLDELARAAQAAVDRGPGPGGEDSSFRDLQAIAEALTAAATALDDHSDGLTQIVIANELIPAEPPPGACPCPVCAYMRGELAAMLAESTPQEVPA